MPKIIVLYDPYSLHTMTVREHLNSLHIYWDAQVDYCPAVDHAKIDFDFNNYDVVLIHYSVRVALGWHFSSHIEKKLASFNGILVHFAQDEYENTHYMHDFLRIHQPDLFFTCVPDPYIEKIYPANWFPKTRFVNNFTGYVSTTFETLRSGWGRIEDRPLMIAYRGRTLPAIYGELGREKVLIAKAVRKAAEEEALPVDIEWDDQHRIYGRAWYEFLQKARASLGTESGSNVFDLSGELKERIQQFKRKNPRAGYQHIWEEFVRPHDHYIQMNQIAPRFFECIAHGTVLILFEGNYLGILEPERHYIELKKDFSNIKDVFAKVQNAEICEKIRNRAFEDIILSGRYDYKIFMQKVAENINLKLASENKIGEKLHPDIDDLYLLAPRPVPGRLHAKISSIPIDVDDETLIPAKERKARKYVPASANGLPRPYPSMLSSLAAYFPQFVKRPIKALFFSENFAFERRQHTKNGAIEVAEDVAQAVLAKTDKEEK